MSQRDKILLAVVAVAVLVGGGWFVVLRPQRHEAQQLGAQIADAQTRLTTAQTQAAQERAARAQLGGSVGDLVAAGRALPTQIAMPDVLRGLERTALNMGVTMSSLTTGGGASASTAGAATSSTAGGVTTQTLNLTFQGGFVDLQRFLARLQRLVRVTRQRVEATGRLLSLTSVKLAPGASAGARRSLTATVGATVYVMQPAAAATAAGTTSPAAPAITPGASPTPTASAGVTR